jgi:hypothetical protein
VAGFISLGFMEEVKDGRMTSAFMIMGLADITQGVVD